MDQIRGIREAATEVVAQTIGGGVGLAGGALGGIAGALATGEIGTPQGARRVQETAVSSAERGTAVARNFLRGSDGRGQPVSPAGHEYIEDVGSVIQNVPALIAAPRGTVGMSPQQPLGIKPALRAAGDTARAVGSRAIDAVVPEIAPRSVARVQMATDAGIPIAPHQLASSSVAKAAGKAAGEVPFSGGASLRKAQREGVSGGLAKAIDPESTAKVLDDVTFAKLQDAAGERIGEIAARTDVPVETFGDLTTITRRDTPDVQGVISTYATDLANIASDNGGVVPGTVLRKLRTEAQTQARAARANKGDLARALDDFVKRVDEAVTEHAPEVDVAGLLEARRQYAVSKSLEPLVAKFSDGNIPPQALKAALTGTKEGKRRMARGKAGELGEYANLGSEILSEQAISTIPERNLVYRALGDVAAAGKLAVVYPFALAYNKLGPRAVKWVAERQARAAAPVPPKPGLELAPEGPLPPRPAGEAPASPLGDLTPDWETAPGAAPTGPRAEAVPAEGLVQAVDSPQGPARVQPGGYDPRPGRNFSEAGPMRPGPAAPAPELPRGVRPVAEEIPAVPGRPDLPDAMVAGPPAELAATEPVGAAMQEPTTALARRQQEAARLAAETQSPEVQKVLAEHAKKLERQAAAEAAKQKRLADAAELRRVAAQTADPEIQQALHARAATLEAAEPMPAGKVKEGAPATKAAPAKADKPVPAGEVTEIAAEVVEPAPVAAKPEPVEPAPRRTEPRVGKAGPKDKFVVGRVYRDSQGNMAIRQADGSWKEIK